MTTPDGRTLLSEATAETEDFESISDGEWVQPVRRGYRMKCCDCGLVHRLDFKLVKYGNGKSKIRFRAFREPATLSQLIPTTGDTNDGA